MADGFRRLRINTQERAMSPDINRLQSFIHQDVAELFRGLFDTYVVSDDNDLTEVSPSVIETPLRAEIINGLMVKPQGTTLNLLVDPGTAFILAPDSAPDESPYKYIRDAGVLVAGTLTMTANASGSTRIDVIECSIDPTDAVVTDSRDIFNSTTGLFAAATVTKELLGRLVYRVRLGTPGAGMPANQQGWLPLCVASVPTGTTTNNTITFWDVRPMVGDRPSLASRPLSRLRLNRCMINAGTLTAAIGNVEAELNGRRLGGQLRTGSVAADAQSIDLTAATNRDSAFAVVASTPWYFYLCTPFGLPRWARYTDGPTGRVPRSPKGIPIVTNVAPTIFGAPSAAINLPTASGLGGTVATTEAICIGAGHATAAAAQTGFLGDLRGGFHLALTTSLATVALTAFAGGSVTSFSIPTTAYPAHANELLIQFNATLTTTVAGVHTVDPQVRVYAADGVTLLLAEQVTTPSYLLTQAGAYNNNRVRVCAWIPLPPSFPNARAAQRVDVDFVDLTGDTVWSAPTAKIIGWRF